MKLKYKSKMRQRQREVAKALKVATKVPKPKTTSADRMRKLRARRRAERHDSDVECIDFDTSHVEPVIKVEHESTEGDPEAVPSLQVDIEMERDGIVKEEIVEENFVCRICLSLGRKMFPLGQFEEIYKMLLYNNYDNREQHLFTTYKICWECRALLQNVENFQNKIRKAHTMLQSQEETVSLSNLGTVIFDESSPIIINITELIEQKNTQTENITKEIEDKVDDKIEDNHEKDIPKEKERKVTNHKKIDTKISARKSSTKDKRPKFKLVNGFDGIIKRVIYTSKVLKEILEERRNKKSYLENDFKCESCVQIFKNENDLVGHNRDFHNKKIRKYICDICLSRFSNIKLLTSHLTEHYNMYYCKVCEFKCPSEIDAKRHANLHGGKTIECLTCGRVFGDRRKFYDHYKKNHELFICDHCGKNFKMKYSLATHIRKNHTKPECHICNKKFSRYNSLWLHNKVFHGPPSESAYCVECDIKFTDIYRYKWHLANSVKHRPRKCTRVQCPGCDKEFTKKIYMQNHYDVVHLKLIKYKCDSCQKYFGRNADLVKHQRRVHDGVQPPKNKICQICGRGFSTNNVLANHVRTHTGERPFVCEACPAAFAQAAALSGHVKNCHKLKT